jgi:UDP-N-acetylglucosamine--N-acetylmuramyl-(pentapeptide) pyrophosphoryl-undecaprenol N-acetylglucosamine transferase
MPKFLLSGGGTGGHIFPALAIAEELRAVYPDCALHFVGALGRMEMEKVPAAGYSITGLPIRGLQRSLSLQNLKLPFDLIRSLRQANSLLSAFKPDCVIGTGGYASGAIVFAAAWRGIPTLIWEGNGFAGLTNRWLGKRVDIVCAGFEEMESFFPKEKIRYTGNPVRKDILSLPARAAGLQHFGLEDSPVCLVIGGSLGAGSLNSAMSSGVDELLAAGIQVIWQCGKHFDTAPFRNKKGLWCGAFIPEMHLAYAAADLVVSRSGALSVSEIAVAGKPSILVPSPNVTADHQTANARKLSDQGAAILLPDAETPRLPALIRQTMADETTREKMHAKLQTLARPGASTAIVQEIRQLIQS